MGVADVRWKTKCFPTFDESVAIEIRLILRLDSTRGIEIDTLEIGFASNVFLAHTFLVVFALRSNERRLLDFEEKWRW